MSWTVELQLYYNLAHTLILIVTDLTAAFAFFLLLIQLFCRAVPIGAHHPFWDPWFIHTPFHALHNEVKQSFNGFAYVIPISCTGFKIRYSAEDKTHKLTSHSLYSQEKKLYTITATYLGVTSAVTATA